MDEIKDIITKSTQGFLYLPVHLKERAVPLSQIKYIDLYDHPFDYEVFVLDIRFGKIDYTISFNTREEALKGRDMLVSFIDKNLHSNEIKDLKNDIEELKEMIKYLPILGEEYKKAKDHYYNPNSK